VATFAAMKRFLGMAILIAFTSVVWGQTSGNPFDLKYRPAKLPTTIKPTSPAVSPDTFVNPGTVKPVPNPQPGIIKPGPDTSKMSLADTLQDSLALRTNPFERSAAGDTQQSFIITGIDTAADTKAVDKTPVLKPKSKASRGFQIFFLLLSILFLIFIVNVERSFVRDLWRVISNENYSSLHHRNQRNTMRQILLMMGYAVFIIQAGLFILHSLRVYGYQESILTNIWLSIGLVLGIYLTRHAVIRYLRWLFNNDKQLTLFSFDISIFNTMVGLVLLPINVMLIFGPDNIHKPLVVIGIIAIAAAYLLRQLRWLLTARQLIANSLFLFFVYLCAVEILPLWAISKLFW
jgi:hypothetical protein